jgi:hypothetical protein
MRKHLTLFLIPMLSICFVMPTLPQLRMPGKNGQAAATQTTSGIADVIEIERLAASKKALEDALAARKRELAEAQAALKAKADKIRAEIAQLQKERDDLIKDLKGGFFCSKCKRAKSEFERQGQSFEKHLGDVQGVAEEAPTDRLEKVREDYSQKIAYKRVQLQRLEQNDPDVKAKKAQVEDAEKKLKDLCDQMTRRSQSYGKTLEGETKSKHSMWVKELLSYASDIYIAEDRVSIAQARRAAELKDFEKISQQARDDAEKANMAEREKRQSRITVIDSEIPKMEAALRERLAPLEEQRNVANARIAEIDALLRTVGMKPEEKTALTAERASLVARNAQASRTIAAETAAANKGVQALQSEEMRLRGEISRLTSSLITEQNAAVEKLRPAHTARLAAIDKQIAAANTAVASARAAYKTKEAFYSGENTAFYNLVSSESNRIVIAGRDSSCPIANEARQFVASNWNKLQPCVSGATTRAKPYSTHVFGSYCPAEVSASALSKYKSFLSGLPPADLDVIKANSNVGWYESLSK